MIRNLKFYILLNCILFISHVVHAADDEIETRKLTLSGFENNQQEIEVLRQKIENIEAELRLIKKRLEPTKQNIVGNNSDELNSTNPITQQPDEKKAYDLALADLKDQKFEDAEKKFARFIADYPTSKLQSNAYFWYGESFFRRSIFDKAAIYYLRGYKQFPKGAKAADSLLKLALALGDNNQKQEACKILIRLEAEFPKRSTASIKRAKDASVKYGCKNQVK